LDITGPLRANSGFGARSSELSPGSGCGIGRPRLRELASEAWKQHRRADGAAQAHLKALNCDDPDRYLASIDGYFRTAPYTAWFNPSFEPLLLRNQ